MTPRGRLLFLNFPFIAGVSTAELCDLSANIIISYRGYVQS